MPDLSLPVSSLDEALPLLRRPFTPEAIKFKVQTVFPEAKGCVIVSYIDARLVIERLNAVCGPHWDARYSPAGTDGKALWCHLQVFDTQRTDVGTASGIEAEKGRVSDALKRAAVQFGVGVSVYALPQVTLWAERAGDRLERRSAKGKPTLAISPTGLAWLRHGYSEWLGKQDSFGDPLDHGDVADAGGMEEEGEAGEFVAEKPAPLNDERAHVLHDRIDAAYETVDREKVPPGKFRAWRDDAAHSHAELERLAVYLEGLRS
jgi:hypothetical protein